MSIAVITSPASSTQLTTLATAKSELGITDTSDDTYISGLLDRASDAIARYCGRIFGQQTVQETYRLSWQAGISPYSQNVGPYGTPLNAADFRPLVLRYAPIVSITSVVENGTTLDPSLYEADAQSGLLYRLLASGNTYVRSFWNIPTIAVTYVSGWVLPNDTGTRSLPHDIEEACLALIRSAYFSRGADPGLTTQIVEGVGRLNWGTTGRSLSGITIDASIASLLAPYVNRVF